MPNSNTRTSFDSDDKFRLVVEFSTDNATFGDRESEIQRILARVIYELCCGSTGRGIMDSNGNTIGRWYLGDDPATTETTAK